MTIDEKLQHFYDVTVEEARANAAASLEEHRKNLAQMIRDRQNLSMENAQAQIKAETANVRREVNKALSAEQLTIKRDWTRKHNELKELLFSEVRELLKEFTASPQYMDYLCEKVKEARDFAENDQVFIYLSPEDTPLLSDLCQRTGFEIQLSGESFLGGIRATIPHKNILIDHSFAGNYETVFKEFKFDGGPAHE